MSLSILPPWARSTALAASGPAGLIERNEWPEHWETTLEALGENFLTSNDVFFVRSHFRAPLIDASTYRLEVSGLVQNPLSLTFAELRAMPPSGGVHTLECAGNGRGLYKLPNTSGTQWERGAVGTAMWAGVRLSRLLERAGVAPEAKHVWFEAADEAPLPQTPRFLRSIPLAKAMEDVLLAHSMNRVSLPPLHGAPLRAIVPGWYGMASTKWVTRVRVEAAPSDNHFMAKGYRYVYPGEDPALAPPVETIRVKSIITRPLAGSRVPAGRIRVQGFAWAGPAEVRLVEVSTDGGTSWGPARFTGESLPNAWRQWATEVEGKNPATITAMARATDNDGQVQPLAARANASGYANNSIHEVQFRVGA